MTKAGSEVDRTRWLAVLVALLGMLILWEYLRRYGTTRFLGG